MNSRESKTTVPTPVRVACGVLGLGSLGLAIWIAIGLVSGGFNWGDAILGGFLLFAAFDFGLIGACVGEWPLLSFTG